MNPLNPLDTIDKLFRQALLNNELLLNNLSDFDVRDHFERQIPDFISSVPFFCKDKLGSFANGTLVVYRGLVHDIYDPEFYTAAYKNKKTGEHHLSLYRDSIPQHLLDFSEENDYDEDGSDGIILERLAVLCCAVPGESSWLKEDNGSSTTVQADNSSSKKRSLPDDDDDFEVNEMITDSPSLKKISGDSSLKPKPAASSSSSSSSVCDSLVNPALLKFYHQTEDLRLNDMVECLCVYTSDPHLADISTSSAEDEMWGEGVRYPPASVAPRLHCITYRKLGASFPFYHNLSGGVLTAVNRAEGDRFRALVINSDSEASTLASVLADKQALLTAREQVMSLLSDSLGGDRLAAEYLLLTLLSRRLNTHDSSESGDSGVLVGMIALQFTGLTTSEGPELIQDVQSALAQLLPRVVRVAADSTTLNGATVSYEPTRDYELNSMTVSPLRFGVGSVVLVDGTREQQTQQAQHAHDGLNSSVGVALNAVGAKSARAIRSIVAEQKLIVRCGYSDVILRTESPCVIFTAGLRATQQFGDESEVITLPLQSSTAMAQEEEEDELVVGLSDPQLDSLRQWWCGVRLLDTTMSEAMLKFVENEYVQARQSDASITGVDFHRWVNLVRLLAASYGATEISQEHWSRMRGLEKERVGGVRAAAVAAGAVSGNSTAVSPAAAVSGAVDAGATNRVPFSPNSVANNCSVQM